MQSSQIIAHNAKVLWVISLDRNFKSGNVIRLYLTAQLSSSAVCSWYCDTVLKQRWNMFWYNKIQTIILGRYLLKISFFQKNCVSQSILLLSCIWLLFDLVFDVFITVIYKTSCDQCDSYSKQTFQLCELSISIPNYFLNTQLRC